MILTTVVLQPIKRPRSVSPHTLKPKKTTTKKKLSLKNKKFRSWSTQLREEWISRIKQLWGKHTTTPSILYKGISEEISIYWCRCLYFNYCPETQKNQSHIISGTSIPSQSLYSGNKQRFKLNVELSSILEKDIELFYLFNGRLFFTSKITRPDVQACVIYILTRMKLKKELSQGQTLEYRYIICEENIDVFNVTSEQYMYVFWDVIF